MKKNYLLTYLVFTISISFFGQKNNTYNIERFNRAVSENKENQIVHIEECKNGLTTVIREEITSRTKENYSIEVYDQKKLLINSKYFKRKKLKTYNVTNDSIHLYYFDYAFLPQDKLDRSAPFKEKKSVRFMSESYDIRTLKSNTKVLLELDKSDFDNDIFKDFSLSSLSNYAFTSENNQNLALVFKFNTKTVINEKIKDYELNPAIFSLHKKKTFSDVYHVYMYDNSTLQPIYTKKIVLNHAAGSARIYQLSIKENDSSLYMIETEKADRDKYFDLRLKRFSTRNLIRIDSSSVNRVNIGQSNPNIYLSNILVKQFKDKTFLVGGYAQDIYRKNYEGFFKIELNNQLRFIEYKQFPFSKQFIEDRQNVINLNKNTNTKYPTEFNPIWSHNYEFLENGDLIMILNENVYGANGNFKAPGKKSAIVINDGYKPPTKSLFALVGKISSDNVLIWSRCIYVNSKSNRGQQYSFASNMNNESVNIFFNQTPKFISKIYPEYQVNNRIKKKKLNTYTAKINNNGEISYNTFENRYMNISTWNSYRVKNNLYFDNLLPKKQKRLIKVTSK